MTKRSYPAIARFAVAGVFGIAAGFTACDNLPTTIEAPTSARHDIGITTNSTPELGKLKICKTGNIGGSFEFVREGVGAELPGRLANFLANLNLPANLCIVVGEDNGGDQIGSRVRITELGGDLASVSGELVGQEVNGTELFFSSFNFVNGGEVFVNLYHGVTVTFVNHREAPQVCDFITFGRLVTETADGKKVVISGNAGGNKPGGGFLGHFQVEVNGTKHHVADVTSYGPITSGPLSNLLNSRFASGTDKDGLLVEVRLWDGGEPGEGKDVVWVSIAGSTVIATKTIDQGNMQYHNVCRGPGDESLD